MNYGNRYHFARVISWACLCIAFLGLLRTASSMGASTHSRIVGMVMLFGGVIGGITAALVAMMSHAKTINHQDQIGVRTLNAMGEQIRREYQQANSSTPKVTDTNKKPHI